MNAAKLGRMMAKPFLGALEGTLERVTAISLNTETLGVVAVGTADGKVCSSFRLQIQSWDIAKKNKLVEVLAHENEVRGICHFSKSRLMYTCSLDGQLKQWRMNYDIVSSWRKPLDTVLIKCTPHCIDHHPSSNEFLIGGPESCLLYSSTKLDVPLHEWSWGQEPIHVAKFNPVEHNIACALTKDNSVVLIDCRQDLPIRKVKMNLKLNAFSWNPMEPFIFTAASEDYNAYTFDNRFFKFPRRVHRGHVNAVLGVDYSPTGREFVTGGYDSTIRLWQCDSTESFDVYHTRRMKRVLDVKITLDAKFVLSSSSDQSIRLWKAHANEIMGPVQPRQRASLQTFDSLREKFKDHPEIRKILKHRHLPKSIFAANKEHAIIRAKERRKERNTRVFNKNDLPFIPDKEKHVIAQYK
ncbi:DDB1- and CUL4-associated factor 13 [Schistosoma japonicum]|nr:DDB1- and CUL4-associated factor 13 [Schistosoma japonicum]